MKKVRWGVLSTAKIGLEKVIPAMQIGEYSEVVSIASQSLNRGKAAAKQLGIPQVYGSYEELLADDKIDAVYIPLPNHLHVLWTKKVLEAGKHVLCEKPIGLKTGEAEDLLAESKKYPHLKVMEAFMYRHHPQWQKTKQLVNEGKIGDLRTIHSFFSYYNVDPENIRNKAEIGGGGLMDIGCYCISLARFIFGFEPQRVLGKMEYDPEFKTDRLCSGLLEFGEHSSTFTCSTQLSPYQRVIIFGTRGRIEIEVPFNTPPDQPSRIWHQQDDKLEDIVFELCNQYTIQGDLFSQAVLDKTEVPTPFEDSVNNMRILDAVINSAESDAWVKLSATKQPN